LFLSTQNTETVAGAGFQRNTQRVAYHRDGEADVPRDPEALAEEAGDRVRAVAQADAADGDRHPHVLCRGHAAQQIPPHVRV